MTTASAEILHLLVGPLYGNDPSIGIRELVQNAVDAANEMLHQARKNGVEDYHPQIEVEFDESDSGDSFIRVTDNGVGMSLEVLEDYYLKAGASFRRSKWWAEEYVDDSGSASIRRSGRFGVGALAAFLIGPEISVTSRSFLDRTGLGCKFSISLDDDLIEVKRVKAEFGTSISVLVSKSSLEKIKNSSSSTRFSDWFVYKTPAITYRVHGEGGWSEVAPRRLFDPSILSSDSEWMPVQSADFEGVYWSYAKVKTNYDGRLFCNGIFVASSGYGNNLPKLSISAERSPFSIAHPDLAVDDRDGRLPLNVQRSGLSEQEYPFQDALEISISRSLVRDMCGAMRLNSSGVDVGDCISSVTASARNYKISASSLIGFSSGGWFPLEDGVVKGLRLRGFLVELFDDADFDGYICSVDFSSFNDLGFIPYISGSSAKGVAVAFVRMILEMEGWWGMRNPLAPLQKNMTGIVLFLSASVDESLRKKGGLPLYLMRTLSEVVRDEDWVVYQIGESGRSISAHQEMLDLARSTSARAFALVELSSVEENPGGTKFSDAWLEIVSSSIMDFERS